MVTSLMKNKVPLSLIYWKFALIPISSLSYSSEKIFNQKWMKRVGSKIGGFSLHFGHLISFAGYCLLSNSQKEFCLVSGILNCPSIGSHCKYIIAVTDMLPGILHKLLGIQIRAACFGIVISAQSQHELPLWFILLLYFPACVNDNFLTACKFRKEKSLLQLVFGC